MTKFNNLIYLILTLPPKDIWSFFKIGYYLIFGILALHIVGGFIGLPKMVSYQSLVIALIIITIIYMYFVNKHLDIDWESIKDSKRRAKEKNISKPPVDKEPVVEEKTNSSINKTSSEAQTFSFEAILTDTYERGSAPQLASAATNAGPTKVRHMNENNLSSGNPNNPKIR